MRKFKDVLTIETIVLVATLLKCLYDVLLLANFSRSYEQLLFYKLLLQELVQDHLRTLTLRTKSPKIPLIQMNTHYTCMSVSTIAAAILVQISPNLLQKSFCSTIDRVVNQGSPNSIKIIVLFA